MFSHSFSFNTFHDSPDIEVLDYQYGDCKKFGTCADKYRVAEGKAFDAWLTSGRYPRGEFLYVKWRIKETGRVYEDRADLTKRLTADMTDYRIHFVLKGEQLYIYLIPPPGTFPASLKRPVTASMSAYLRKHLIYPDHPKTYPDQIQK